MTPRTPPSVSMARRGLFGAICSVAMAWGGTASADSFGAPSGNILCYLGGSDGARTDALTCLIFEASWSLPPYYGDNDPTCNLDRTRTIILPRRGPATARWTCHGDIFWPLPIPKIGYGSDWSVNGFDCTMRKDGVRCRNATNDGFSVRRRALQLN